MPTKRAVLSIDVGIRNLAICLLSFTHSARVEILEWQHHDVIGPPPCKTLHTEGKRMDETCKCIMKKTKKACGRLAAIAPDGTPKKHCGIHAPKKKKTASDWQDRCLKLLAIGDGLVETLSETLPANGIDEENLEVVIKQQSSNCREMLLWSHSLFSSLVSRFEDRCPIQVVPAYTKLMVYDGLVIECHLKTPYARRKHMAKEQIQHFLSTEEPLHK
ncbi:hypothetical protein HDV00_008597 [Rhizophlyctis rosea]|nr:hypothetical protein HDV00_008597 [Rhizophlyctis rosea]